MTKKEIQEELVAKEIKFDDGATKDELLTLLSEEEVEVEEEEEEEVSAEDKKLSPFLQAYKKQNPRKYKAKKARGELKGL